VGWNRVFFFFAAGLCALLSFGFLLDHPWATWLWPYYTYRMSRIFIASVLLAVAAPVFLIGWKEEWAAVRGGAPNLLVMFLFMGVYALVSARSTPATLFGTMALLFAAVQLILFALALPYRFRDNRPTPGPVLWSFRFFVLVLVAVGVALISRVGNILPWMVSTELSVLYGAVFLSAAVYFAHAIRAGVWGAAVGPLAGFLAYDLVLIGPFLVMFADIPDHLRLSLILYTAVVLFSGALALYYLWHGPDPRE
jgi:hypothetical protein